MSAAAAVSTVKTDGDPPSLAPEKVIVKSNGPESVNDSAPRRSLRKREDKSYAESPDLFIEDSVLSPMSTDSGKQKSNALEAIRTKEAHRATSITISTEGGIAVGDKNDGDDARFSISNSHRNGGSHLELDHQRKACKTAGMMVSVKTASTVIMNNGDVEMESENEEDEVSAPVGVMPEPKVLTPEEIVMKQALIRQLQTKLRNEEMSLVLLKKIRASQILMEQTAVAAAAVQTQANTTATTISNTGGIGIVSINKSSATSSSSGKSGVKMMPDLTHLTPVSVDAKSQGGPNLPANLVNLMSTNALCSSSSATASTSGHIMNHSVASSQAQKTRQAEETPAQKQQAAKQALRKQLEKTLLQIPPPKPPPPEMHFIPNPANSEFVCLLGLEECVSKILHEDDKENTAQPVPFSCSQCSTDFTPTWKWDKGSRGKEVRVICENCVTTNVKKALKAEHTNRLKAAFVKGLQQEQELEANMAAAASSSTTSSSTTTTTRVASPDTRKASSTAAAKAAAAIVGSGIDVTIRPAAASVSTGGSMSSSSLSYNSLSSGSRRQQQHQNSRSSSATSATITPTAAQLSIIQGSRDVATIAPGRTSSRNVGGAADTSPVSINAVTSRHRTNNTATVASSNASNSSSSSSKTSAAAAAAAAAALMGGYDIASLAAFQQMQQQMLMGLGGSAAGSSNSGGSTGGNSNSRGGSNSVGIGASANSATGSNSGGNSSSSASSSSNMAAAAQLAAMMTNPLLYNYQAMAMAAMQQSTVATGKSSSQSGNGGGGGNSSSGSSGNNNSAATNQMLEIQRQATEHLQRQYLLDMIPPGSLAQNWSKK